MTKTLAPSHRRAAPGAWRAGIAALGACVLAGLATGCPSSHGSRGGDSTGDDDGGTTVPATFLTTRVGGAPANVRAVAFQDGCPEPTPSDGGTSGGMGGGMGGGTGGMGGMGGTGGSPGPVDTCDPTWHELTGTAGVYPFEVTGTSYSLAVACSNEYGGFVLVRATPSERPQPVVDCAASATGSSSVQGAVSGYDTNTPDPTATVALGPTTTTWHLPEPDDTNEYALEVGAGTWDLVAVTPSYTPSKPPRMILRRDLAVTGELSVPLDFATDGFALDVAPHALSVVDPQHVAGATDSVTFLTSTTAPRGTGILSGGQVGVVLESWSDRRQTYPVVPANEMEAGDLLCASGVTDETATSSWAQTETRSVRRFFSVPQDLQLSLPPRFEAAVPGATVDARPVEPQAPVGVVDFGVAGRTAGVRGFEIDCGGGGPPPAWHEEISADALGAETSITVPPPDLIDGGISAFELMGYSQSFLCSIGALSGDDPWGPPRDGDTRSRATVEVSFVTSPP